MASISLKDICKIYSGNVTAVDNFNLEIQDKEFIILVGPSGCGKSTTLRMIAGLEEISGGELYIGDKLVNDVAPKDRDIAMVFQNYALYPHMTVFKNMAFGLQLRKIPKAEIKRKVEEAAKILDIEHLLERKPKALSGGQRQRVALGRAMVRDPAVFLLDEPLSNLDAKLRTAMRSEITKLHKRLGTTFVYVTHDQIEAMTMGDRIVVMKDGFIQQVDTPQNLYDAPCNMFVAEFIGSPQMNFLPVTIQRQENGFAALFGSIAISIPPGKAPEEVLASYEGKEVMLGIRPENLHEKEGHANLSIASSLEVTVDLAELMGSEIYLYTSADDCKLTAKVSSHSKARSGEQIRLSVDCTKIHLFDKETQETICN
ncbi:sn-glycerol-3-phosphate ABC transporter ATP-binding protein UgpC [Oscillospiraceae bacterium MB08-C2-2]|nr:sn-glycerol-3-phosphate ABC transporter ATP-binding protein UgpC [Oscillospiraceae bacterium MB08-C2-2]